MGRLTGAELAAWVTASCLAQGVPTKVTDPHVLSHVGTLLTGRAGRTAPARSAGGAHRPAGRGVVQDRPDDRVLTSQVQPAPRFA